MIATLTSVARRLLVFGAVFASAWHFHDLCITPLKLRDNELVRERADLYARLNSATKDIVLIKDSLQKISHARGTLSELTAANGEDAMVSFPARIKEHFSRFGFPSAVVRLVATRENRELRGYQQVYWSVGVPIPETDRNAISLLMAVAQLEQEERSVKVTDFALQSDPENPSLRTASVNIAILAQ